VKRYFLGVDGGGTSTVACVGDARGSVLGTGAAGGCHRSDSLGRCLRLACREAGLNAEVVRFEAAVLGFSGGGAAQRERVGRVVRSGRITVTDDASIALDGATRGEPGIVTIAGTGSISVGRNGAGKRARAGGWGYLFGDEGGAVDIVREAVRAAVRYEEGWGPETRLHGALLEATGAASANEMLHGFYGRGDVRKRLARHAVLVDHAAADGDPIAVELLHNAAHKLATLTAAVRAQLFPPGVPVAVAYVGGVFGSRRVLERFRMLVELEGGCGVNAPRLTPAEGALAAAYASAGLSVTPLRS